MLFILWLIPLLQNVGEYRMDLKVFFFSFLLELEEYTIHLKSPETIYTVNNDFA